MQEAACGPVLGNIKYGDVKCAQIQPNSQSLLTFTLVNENHKMFRADRGQGSGPSSRSLDHPLLSCSGEPLTSLCLCSFTTCQTTLSWGERKIFVDYITIFVKYISRKSNDSPSSLVNIPLAYLKIF